jgi:acetyl-CoA carboxylase carboxyltransferase component
LVAPVCDFRIMSEQGAIFTAGPPVVKESTGEDISKEDLGGPGVALASGVIHNVGEDDETVLDDIRRYLSYFPSSAWSYPSPLPDDETTQPRPTPELIEIVSRDNRRVYDMHSVLDVIFDRPDWFEVQPRFGRAIICALAHLGGHQPTQGAGRLHRRRRRGQGGAFHHGRRLVSPADRLPCRQPRHVAREPV